MTPEIAARPEATAAGPQLPGVFAELSNAMASAFEAVNGFLDLASMELRRAGLAVFWIIGCGAAAALCLIAAWFGVLAGLAIWVISEGLPAWATLVALAALNGAAGVMLLRAAISKSDDLRFFATRRQVAALASPTTGPKQ